MKWSIPTRHSVYLLALLLGVSGCQRGSTDESAVGTLSESGPEEAADSSADMTSPHSVASETPADAAPTTDTSSDGVDRPGSIQSPVPAHIPMPEGGVLLMSITLGSDDKYFVQAQYPEVTDSKELLAQFEKGLAEYGWTPNGEPEDGVANGFGQLFERENETLSINSYSKPDKSGLFVQIESEPK